MHLRLLVLFCLTSFLFATPQLRAAPPARKPNVVLVHGIWRNHTVFDRMTRVLENEGYTCFAPDLTPNDCRHGIRELTRELAADIDARFGPSAPVVLVGFSMGGIIARDYVENVVPDQQRVRGVFLVASAGRGTLLANLSPSAGQRDMAVGSPFLRALNADTAVWKTIPIRAYWTPLDGIVIPSGNARWPEDRSTRVFCVLHPRMASNHEVMTDIATRLKTM